MTVSKAFTIVASCALLGTAVGTGVGYVLGTFTPDFFPAILLFLPEDADRVQVGLGLGVVSGGLIGITVGTVVMGVVTWYEIRVQQLAINQK